MVPAYVNIAHHRAPYKNAYFAGYGQDAPPPPPGPPGDLVPDEGVLAQMVEKKGPLYHWKPEAASSVINMLGSMRTIFVGGELELVEVVPYTQDELAAAAADPQAKKYIEQYSAYTWLKKKLSEGKAVLAPVWITSQVPDRSLVAVDAGDDATLQKTASTPLYAILAEPSWLDKFPGGAVGAYIAGAALVGAVGLAIYAGKKKGGGYRRPSFRMS